MRTLFDVLLSWAVTLSEYPAPTDAPLVLPLPPEELHQRVCGDTRPCAVVALLMPDADEVLIDARLDVESDTEAQSLLVHEFVHFLQRRAGRMANPDMGCEERVALEREAYLVQARFAAEHGSGSRVAAMAIGLLPRICEQPGALLEHVPHAAMGSNPSEAQPDNEPEAQRP
jgi:hypothetical protein